jgi:hypothetical protein
MGMGAKILGALGKSGGLLGGMNRSLLPSQVAGARRNPAVNVIGTKRMSQPYPDAILRAQAAKNLGLPVGTNTAAVWAGAKNMAGKPQQFETFSQELDRDWLNEVGKSLAHEEELTAPSGGRIGQPSPGDFQNQFDIASYSPWIEKYKRKGLFS